MLKDCYAENVSESMIIRQLCIKNRSEKNVLKAIFLAQGEHPDIISGSTMVSKDHD